MLTIAKLFGKSPFAPLETHMKKVSSCIHKLEELLESLPKKDSEKIEKLSQEICKLEHEADLTKNDIRNHLPRSLFLPIDRGQFLEILSIQDSIADVAEDVALLLVLRGLDNYQELHKNFQLFYQKAFAVYQDAKKIIGEIDELLEASFGGIEAEKVKALVEMTSYKEHETDRHMRLLMKQLFSLGETMSPPAFTLWVRLIEGIGLIANLSEKLANRIRMVLEVK